MVEADIQGELGRFIRDNILEFDDTFTCEVKLVKGNRFDFGKIAEHQIVGLAQAKEGIYHKLSDAFVFDKKTGKNKQAQHRPFDFVFIKTPRNYVCICFYEPRKKKVCYFVHLSNYLDLEADFKAYNKKSCHEDDIKEYAEFTIDLLKQTLI